MISRRSWARLCASLAGLLLLAASICGATAADKVTLRTSWTWWPGNAPFFVAQEKGFYRDVNLEVDILQGQGSKTTSIVVGQGRDMFGENSMSTTATSISAGVPVKVVAGYWQRGPIGLVCDAGLGIKSPADIRGRTVASSPSGSDAQLLPAFLNANNLSMQDIKLVALGDAKLPAFVAGRVDCVSGDIFYWQPQALAQGKKSTSLLYADYGITNLSYGIIAGTELIDKNPDLVRRFVAATTKGVAYALGHTDEAADIYLKHSGSNQAKDLVIGVLEYWKGQLHTKNTMGKPLGSMAAKDWDEMNTILEKYADMKGRKPADAYFTDEFVPEP